MQAGRFFALSRIDKLIGVAEYQLARAISTPLDTSRLGTEEIEVELSRDLEWQGGK